MTGVDPRLSQWRPVPAVVLPAHEVPQPAVPVVDVHNHIGRWLAADGSWLAQDTAELAATLATAGVETLVNLDGRWGDDLVANVDRYDRAAPGAYVTFCHVEWAQLADSGGPDDPELVGRLTAQLEQSAEGRRPRGQGLEGPGVVVRDATGALVRPDDPRVVAVLQAAGDLGLPVLIHSADPVAFFEPLDERNERLDELGAMPQWWFGGPEHPTFAELIEALHRLVGACPGTTFIGAHVGCHAEDLGAVGDALTRLPNWNVDTGGRLGEVGRQPRAFRRLVEAFPDRVLFGSDCYPPDLAEYRRWWRFLETDDEHFSYCEEGEIPPQGRWRISGAALPRTLLPALYRDNAHRLLGL